LVLISLIFGYDKYLKNTQAGPFTIAAARVMNVTLGTSASLNNIDSFPQFAILVFVLTITFVYVSLIGFISKYEIQGFSKNIKLYLISVVIAGIISLIILFTLIGFFKYEALIILVLFAFIMVKAAYRIHKKDSIGIQQSVEKMIMSIIVLDSTYLSGIRGLEVGLAVIRIKFLVNPNTCMVKHVIVIDIVGLERKHISENITPNIFKISQTGETRDLETVFPAVTCTVQSSLLSGSYPEVHGIISNGLYDRQHYTVSFWEQSSNLVQADRVWDTIKMHGSVSKTAVLFWQNTIYSNADLVLTPRPLHMDDRMIMWCYSKPPGFYEKLIEKIGKFDLTWYWGPLVSKKSSEWIEKATEFVLENEKPSILFTYIPHLDYSFQKNGTSYKVLKDDLKFVDDLVGRLVKKVSDMGMLEDTQFIIFSEYGFTDVNSDISLNSIFRENGLLEVREIEQTEYLDLEYSKAFAMVDHQIAHIYVKENQTNQVRKILEGIKGVDMILDNNLKQKMRVNHPRSGDIIAVSTKDKWFSYYWWFDPDKAPSFAKKVDIHRKPGYDPVELFFDPNTNSIPLDGKLVRGSHGRIQPQGESATPVYVSNIKNISETKNGDNLRIITVGQYLKNLF
jgi:predicted AlkP superfamily pyrophosphatase or phosphodiesterase